jgi:hypothetical protein
MKEAMLKASARQPYPKFVTEMLWLSVLCCMAGRGPVRFQASFSDGLVQGCPTLLIASFKSATVRAE